MLNSRVILHEKLKMATNNVPKTKHPRLGFRYQMEVNFTDEESKKVFLTCLDKAKSSLSSSGLRNVDNYKLITSLLDRFEEEMGLDSNGIHGSVPIIPPPRPMLKHSGKLWNNNIRL